MDIDSVRALKAEIAEKVVEPLVEEDIRTRTFGVPASSLRKAAYARPAIALGVSRGKGKRDFRLAVRIQRRSLENDPRVTEWITRAAKQEVEYRYIGRLTKQATSWHQSRQRPLLIGSSVGHFAITAGTVGAFVRDKKSLRPVLLSNNHVLANEDRATVGDAILQQGAIDGGRRPADVIGRLGDFVSLKSRSNLVDAAIASLEPDVDFDPTTLTGLGTLGGLRAEPIEPGQAVMKVGRTTGVTRGLVTAIELDDVVVGFERGELSFDSQIEIEGVGPDSFSAGGDSGSLILDDRGMAAALLFAGGDTGGSNGKGLTYANDIHTVLAMLNIELAL